MSISFKNVDSLPSRRERFCWFHMRHLNWAVKCSTNKVKVRNKLIYTLSRLILTTFCKPSMRLLTTCRRPLSSWNMVLSSSHERSHISAPASSVFWPMTFVVMEGLTSTISVLSLTVLASSGGAGKETRRQGGRGKRMSNTDDGDGKHIREIRWLKREDSDFLFSRTQTKAHNNVAITMFIVFPKNRCSVSGVRLVKCILFERVTLNLSTSDDSRVGYKKKDKQETEIWMLFVWNHTAVVALFDPFS